MKAVSKSKLKAKMLEYFREIERTGEPLVVTSHGVPVLRVAPYRPSRSTADCFADCRGKLRVTGDLLAPTEDEWSAT